MVDEIVKAAAGRPEAEICGLLLGRGSRVEAAVPCTNVAPDPRDSFEIDPVALIAAHRRARQGGPLVIGSYHSHPHGPAEPSARDEAAAEPGSFWLIVGEGEARGWHASPQGFVHVSLDITE